MEVQEQKPELKKAKLEKRKGDFERLHKVIIQNQQNQSLMVKQQQVNLTLLQFLTKQNVQK